MRKYYWYLSAYWRKHGKILISSVMVSVLIFSVSLPFLLQKIDFKKREYIGVVGSYDFNTLPADIQEKISFGLTKIETDGTVSPAASQRWSIEDDGTTYRFIIRPDLVWQDGSAFSPRDVNYQLQDTEIITTTNDVVFKLKDIFVPFPNAVAMPLFKTVKQPLWIFFSQDKIIGLGEYQIIDHQLQHNRIKELVLDSAQKRITYRFYLTENDAVTAFKHGQVDVVTNLTHSHDIGDWDSTTINKTLLTNHYLALFFDTSHPILTKNIRQALSYSLPKPEKPLRAIGPISPDSWVYLDAGKAYDYDLERALERLFSDLPEQELKFSLTTTPNFIDEADQIKKYFEEFGQTAYQQCQTSDQVEDNERELCENVKIQVEVKISNFPDTHNFETLLIAQESPPDPDQYAFWHSDQAGNITKYKNTRIDSLLEKGRQVADKEERKTIYQEFQQFLLEDAPAIFLQHLEAYEVRRK